MHSKINQNKYRAEKSIMFGKILEMYHKNVPQKCTENVPKMDRK